MLFVAATALRRRVCAGNAGARRQSAVPTAALILASCSLGALTIGAAPDLAGRYVVAILPTAADAPVAQATFAGTVDITLRRPRVSAVSWLPSTVGARRQRGLGLSDDDGALGVSISTGGAAYGVAIYRHTTGSGTWQGRWITSLDSGGTLGEIRFDGPAAAASRARSTALRRAAISC